MQFVPFYNIYSKALHILLGVEDMRSVMTRLKNLGVKVYGHGKDAYILTEEFVDKIKRTDPKASSYQSKSPYADL